MPEVIALQSMFEGLYVRALQPEGPFKEALRAKGFDLDRQKSSYPISVWIDCLDVTSAELYPGQAHAAAWQQIGYRFIEGYFETLVGRMIAVMLPFLSARSFMGRVPTFIRTGLQGASVHLDWQGNDTLLLTIGGVHRDTGAVMAGVLQGSFKRMKLNGVSVVPRALDGLESEVLVTLP